MPKTDLLKTEHEYWDALMNHDAKAVERLTDQSCIVVGAQGVSEFDPPSAAAMVNDMPYELQSYHLGEQAKVRMLGRNVAIVAYPVHESVRRNGNLETLDAVDASVWVRRDGHWTCALHTETMADAPADSNTGGTLGSLGDALGTQSQAASATASPNVSPR